MTQRTSEASSGRGTPPPARSSEQVFSSTLQRRPGCKSRRASKRNMPPGGAPGLLSARSVWGEQTAYLPLPDPGAARPRPLPPPPPRAIAPKQMLGAVVPLITERPLSLRGPRCPLFLFRPRLPFCAGVFFFFFLPENIFFFLKRSLCLDWLREWAEAGGLGGPVLGQRLLSGLQVMETSPR